MAAVNWKDNFTEIRQMPEMMVSHPALGANTLIVYLSRWAFICEWRLGNQVVDTTLGLRLEQRKSVGLQNDSPRLTDTFLAALY